MHTCIDAGASEENAIDTESYHASDDSPITAELKSAYTALSEVHMTESNGSDGGNDAARAYDSPGPIAVDVNPSYMALAQVHMTDSNIVNGHYIDVALDSAIVMEVNPSYATLAEVHVRNCNINDGNNDAAHAYDSPDPIVMEVNPSYVALAEVHTHTNDSNINATNVHLQENPSYIALPMTTSQGQE